MTLSSTRIETALPNYLLDTGWVESTHIAGVLTDHLVTVVPAITELTYIIADVGFSPSDPNFASHYVVSKMDYDGEAFAESQKSYRFNYITGTYEGSISAATAVQSSYSPLRCAMTGLSMLLPNMEIASAVLFPQKDTPATLSFETSSGITTPTAFSFRFRAINHTQALKFIGSVMP
jgi:hypothetical protein